jgi:hypothetical protein
MRMAGKGKKFGKKYAKQNGLMDILFPPAKPKPAPRKSKRQDSAKVHNTKGKNYHGRSK